MRFQYDPMEQPPAPYIDLQVSPHNVMGQMTTVSAKLDSGASVTVIPSRLAQHWNMLPISYSRFRGYDGSVTTRPTYRVDIRIGMRQFKDIRVTTSLRRNILLGRDVMNQLRILLDGPQQTVEVQGV